MEAKLKALIEGYEALLKHCDTQATQVDNKDTRNAYKMLSFAYNKIIEDLQKLS